MKIFATALAATTVLSSIDASSLRTGQNTTVVSKHETMRYLAVMNAPPTCVPENGNDIDNALGAAADYCNICLVKTWCKAYS